MGMKGEVWNEAYTVCGLFTEMVILLAATSVHGGQEATISFTSTKGKRPPTNTRQSIVRTEKNGQAG